ncbi:hypothetical protein E2C01_060487 [Portunus trituberculatus]|uniref:Uncharacterized protein n=1 Tax=Portunus trituberculatus TaxID=210409 RepID=A0A5B7H960_PORTR|nr:hypothetical protein [Portunus trituberculatus]
MDSNTKHKWAEDSCRMIKINTKYECSLNVSFRKATRIQLKV